MITCRLTFKYIVLMTMLGALVVNCSTVNPESPLSFVDSSGNHPDGWIPAHGQFGSPDGSLCMDCHGDDLAGGISGVSCFSDAAGCHAGGPAFHPADWLDSSLTGNDWHGDAYDNGFQVNGLDCVDCHEPPALDDPVDGKCIICHFTLSGGRSPGGWAHADTGAAHAAYAGSIEETVCVACHDVNISFGNQDSCHNCHDVANHDVEYLDHDQDVPDLTDFESQCSVCHAVSGTSPNAGAPVCVSCHVLGSPYTRTSCRSCHGRPPNSGEHGEHGNTCSDCHQGAGSGSGLNHFYDGDADVAFPATINIDYDGSRCTDDCHGREHNYSW